MNNNWTGYNFEELCSRRLVTRLQIDISLDEFRGVFNPHSSSQVSDVSNFIDNLKKAVKFGRIVLSIYSVVKILSRLFPKKRN